MKIKKVLLLSLFIFSCGSNQSSLKISCPSGAPSLAFYTYASDTNFNVETVTSKVLAEFQKTEKDILVIDAINGLSAIKKYENCVYRFAKLLTAGNIFLISTTKNVDPAATNTFIGFGNEKSVPHLMMEYVLKNKFSLTGYTVEYKDSVSNVLVSAKSDQADYYLLAEPLVTTLSKEKNITYKKSIKDLANEVSSNLVIPQAAIFVNKNNYESNKSSFTSFFNQLNENINNLITNPTLAKKELDKYGDDEKVKTRFGFTSTVAYEVQSNNNGFAFYESNKTYTYEDTNNFLETVAKDVITDRFSSEQFINV